MVSVYESEVDTVFPAHSSQVTVQELEQRLERGLRIIEDRSASGQSVDRHEDHWMALLREYETLYDSLQ